MEGEGVEREGEGVEGEGEGMEGERSEVVRVEGYLSHTIFALMRRYSLAVALPCSHFHLIF